MEVSALVVGQTYYRLTFVDPDMTMPGLQPLVYVGEHEDQGQLLPTFQDTVSYRVVGAYPGGIGNAREVEVLLFPMTWLEAAEMHTLAGVVAELSNALARADRLGFPALKSRQNRPNDAA